MLKLHIISWNMVWKCYIENGSQLLHLVHLEHNVSSQPIISSSQGILGNALIVLHSRLSQTRWICNQLPYFLITVTSVSLAVPASFFWFVSRCFQSISLGPRRLDLLGVLCLSWPRPWRSPPCSWHHAVRSPRDAPTSAARVIVVRRPRRLRCRWAYPPSARPSLGAPRGTSPPWLEQTRLCWPWTDAATLR